MSNYFIKGIPIKESIRNHDNIYDFCAGVRGIGGWRVELFNQKENSSKVLQKTNRYFVTEDAASENTGLLLKYHEDGRVSHVEAHPLKGRYYNCTIFILFEKFDYNINYLYYEKECRKIINNIEEPQLKLFN